MKISVITICYNCEKTIEKTIKSVLEQKYNDIELEFDSGDPIFSFWLHKGTYATSFMREIMKSSDVTAY